MKLSAFLLTALLAIPLSAQAAEPMSIAADSGANVFASRKVDKVVKATWSNMGSWLAIYEDTERENAFSVEMSFGGPGYEEMGEGGSKAHLANHFMKLINAKASRKIRLKSISNDGYVVTLNFADGTTISWDYGDRLPPLAFRTGAPQKPYPRTPRCPAGSGIPRPCIPVLR